MRKIASFVVLIAALLFLNLLLYRKDIVKYLVYNIVYKYEVIEKANNAYHIDYSYNYVQATDNFYPKNKQAILNVIYTAINNGWDNFSFVCYYNYTTCENDVKAIASDVNTLTNINNFVHPYNSYNKLNIAINGFGKVTITIDHLYTDAQINYVNTKVDETIKNMIKPKMTDREKIKIIHDYIIKITTYDSERAEAIKNNIDMSDNFSNLAFGIFSQGKAVCGGYADLMAIFLDRFGIENYKISTANHVWNLVRLEDGNWYHLDLTWDDTIDGQNNKYNLFYLITTTQLEQLVTGQHIFDKSIFVEAE